MHVLIAEDDPRIAKSLSTALGAAGFAAEVEADGENAWFRGDTEDLGRHHPRPWTAFARRADHAQALAQGRTQIACADPDRARAMGRARRGRGGQHQRLRRQAVPHGRGRGAGAGDRPAGRRVRQLAHRYRRPGPRYARHADFAQRRADRPDATGIPAGGLPRAPTRARGFADRDHRASSTPRISSANPTRSRCWSGACESASAEAIIRTRRGFGYILGGGSDS